MNFTVVKCVQNRAAFFAEQLYKSMKGFGTDDDRLIRLVVTRCEIDMGEIKEAFRQQYNESLEDFIAVSITSKKIIPLRELINYLFFRIGGLLGSL